MSEYQHEGPASTLERQEFIVHATLEPGAEKYFSGFRVLIGCKDSQKLATLVRTI